MRAILLLTLCASSLLAGCVSVDAIERATVDEARAAGLPVPHHKECDPTTAALLNILPGIGNIYLGIVTEEKSQWFVFVGNLLLWPLSVVWGIPQAGIDAGAVNEKSTAHYYMVGKGKEELEAAKRRAGP